MEVTILHDDIGEQSSHFLKNISTSSLLAPLSICVSVCFVCSFFYHPLTSCHFTINCHTFVKSPALCLHFPKKEYNRLMLHFLKKILLLRSTVDAAFLYIKKIKIIIIQFALSKKENKLQMLNSPQKMSKY